MPPSPTAGDKGGWRLGSTKKPVPLLPGSDCGTSRFKYLSHAAAKAYREKNMPHEITLQASDADKNGGLPTLGYRKHPLVGTHTGYHPFCARRSRSDLDKYGAGVVLYFKFLKWGVAMFTLMSLLYTPALVLFYSGDAWSSVASGGTAAKSGGTVSLVTALSQFSLGNLGEPTTVCGDGYEGNGRPVTLTCPAGKRILKLEAFYGNISGSCACPSDRVPSPKCTTPQGLETAADGDLCLPRGSACHNVAARPVSLPSGSRFTSGSCCARKLSFGREDFGELDFRTVGGCAADASVVEPLARGVCLGRDSCTLHPDRGVVHTWNVTLEFGTKCPGVGGRILHNSVCTAALGQGPNRDGRDPGLARCAGTNGSSWETARSAGGGGARLVVVARCYSETIRPAWWHPGSPPLSKEAVALIVVGCEVAAVLVFLAGWWALSTREGQSAWARTQITAADYTLMLQPLPPHDDLRGLESELRAHLEATLTACPPQVRGDLPTIALADVNFALRDTHLIRLFVQRGELLVQMERLSKVALLAERSMVLGPGKPNKDGSPGKPKVDEGQAERFKRTVQFINRLRNRLGELDARIDASEIRAAAEGAGLAEKKQGSSALLKPARAVAAFVTFEEEEGVLRAQAAYPSSAWGWLCQPRHLRFRGTHRLAMRRAPQPSDIRWENFGVSRVEAGARRILSAALVLGVLLLAAYGIFAADQKRREAVRLYPDVNCNALPGDIADKEAVLRDTFPLRYNSTLGNTGRLGCYCKALVASEGVQGVVRDVLKVLQPDGSLADTNLCSSWLTTYIGSQLLIYGISTIILGFNLLLRVFIYYLVDFERHTTITSELRSRGVFLFIVQVLNTGGLILLLNAYINTTFVLLRTGTFWDFTAPWYTSVGTSITLTMLLQVVTIHLGPLVFGVIKSAARCWDRGCGCDRSLTRKKTQGELNQLYMGIEFALDERYAQLYTSLFVNLTYAGGLPLLVPTLAATFALMYVVDKWLFLRHYNTPPQYDAQLGRNFTALLPLAMVIHLAFTIWQLSSPDVFPTLTSFVSVARQFSDTSAGDAAAEAISRGMSAVGDLDIGERVTTFHVIPLSLLLAVMVAGLLWRHVLLAAFARASTVLCCCASDAARACCARRRVRGAGLPNFFLAVPPDVVDEVTAGLRPVKPSLAARLKDTKAAHQAVRERATLAQLLASYEKFNAVVAALQALRGSVRAQADAFLADVHDALTPPTPKQGEEGGKGSRGGGTPMSGASTTEPVSSDADLMEEEHDEDGAPGHSHAHEQRVDDAPTGSAPSVLARAFAMYAMRFKARARLLQHAAGHRGAGRAGHRGDDDEAAAAAEAAPSGEAGDASHTGGTHHHHYPTPLDAADASSSSVGGAAGASPLHRHHVHAPSEPAIAGLPLSSSASPARPRTPSVPRPGTPAAVPGVVPVRMGDHGTFTFTNPRSRAASRVEQVQAPVGTEEEAAVAVAVGVDDDGTPAVVVAAPSATLTTASSTGELSEGAVVVVPVEKEGAASPSGAGSASPAPADESDVAIPVASGGDGEPASLTDASEPRVVTEQHAAGAAEEAPAASPVRSPSSPATAVAGAGSRLSAASFSPSDSQSSSEQQQLVGGLQVDGTFVVTAEVLAQLRIQLDAPEESEQQQQQELELSKQVGDSAAGTEPGVATVTRRQLLEPTNLHEVAALRERLLGSLTLPPAAEVRVGLEAAVAHTTHVMATIDYVLASVGNRGLKLYEAVSKGIDAQAKQRAEFTGGAGGLDSTMQFLLSRAAGMAQQVAKKGAGGAHAAAGALQGAAAAAPTDPLAASATHDGGPSVGAPAGAPTPDVPDASPPRPRSSSASSSGATGPGHRPRKSLLSRLSLGGGSSSSSTSSSTGGEPGPSSSSPSKEGRDGDVELVEGGYLVGQWCFDMHEDRTYIRLFGLEAAVAANLKRRMVLSSAGGQRDRSASAPPPSRTSRGDGLSDMANVAMVGSGSHQHQGGAEAGVHTARVQHRQPPGAVPGSRGPGTRVSLGPDGAYATHAHIMALRNAPYAYQPPAFHHQTHRAHEQSQPHHPPPRWQGAPAPMVRGGSRSRAIGASRAAMVDPTSRYVRSGGVVPMQPLYYSPSGYPIYVLEEAMMEGPAVVVPHTEYHLVPVRYQYADYPSHRPAPQYHHPQLSEHAADDEPTAPAAAAAGVGLRHAPPGHGGVVGYTYH